MVGSSLMMRSICVSMQKQNCPARSSFYDEHMMLTSSL